MCARGDRCVVLMTAYSAVIPTPGQGGGEVHFRGLPALPLKGLSRGKCPIWLTKRCRPGATSGDWLT